MPPKMTSRQRLLATLRGEPVDRVPVNFYEIGGLRMDPDDPDPFNVYHDPSWRPLLELAEQETDLIRMRSAVRAHSHESWDTGGGLADGVRAELLTTRTWLEQGARFARSTIRTPGHELSMVTRREPDVDTVWTVEPLLKNRRDLDRYLGLPDAFFDEPVDVGPLLAEEVELGERGLVMVDTEDPLCAAATLFRMEDFTVLAFTEPDLFERLLTKLARALHARTEQVAREFPGRLWRIYGPEFASEPYLPPTLFQRYVVGYTGPMVSAIQRYGGWVRIHCHGRNRNILDHVVQMGADAVDPLEPPPHGDVRVEDVRQRYGRQLVLFGNIEVTDLEQRDPPVFAQLVRETLHAGTVGTGRGFVLMPSASPYGRQISPRTLENYRTMVRLAAEHPVPR